MTPLSFVTQPLPRRDQFEAWRAWFSPVLDVIPDRQPEAGFAAENCLWRLGGLAMTRTVAAPSHVVRDQASLRREPVDHWVLSYCPRGAHHISTARAALDVPPRVPFLWSMGEAFEHWRTHIDRLQLFLSRDACHDVASVLDAACGLALDTPLGHLLGDWLLALEQRLPALTHEDMPGLADAARAMVAAAVAPSVERVAIAGPQIDVGRMERRAARGAQAPALATPWSEDAIPACRHVAIEPLPAARRQRRRGPLHIQRARLAEANRALIDPAGNATIAEDFARRRPTRFWRRCARPRVRCCAPRSTRPMKRRCRQHLPELGNRLEGPQIDLPAGARRPGHASGELTCCFRVASLSLIF